MKTQAEKDTSCWAFITAIPIIPAKPSEYDRTHVPPWAFYSHVIVAIHQAKPVDMTGWRMDEETEQFEDRRFEREIRHGSPV